MLKQRIGEYGPDSGGRVKGVTLIKPIVFGNQVSLDNFRIHVAMSALCQLATLAILT